MALIQLLKKKDCFVAVSCSSRNTELVRGYGADAVSPFVVKENLEYALAYLIPTLVNSYRSSIIPNSPSTNSFALLDVLSTP